MVVFSLSKLGWARLRLRKAIYGRCQPFLFHDTHSFAFVWPLREFADIQAFNLADSVNIDDRGTLYWNIVPIKELLSVDFDPLAKSDIVAEDIYVFFVFFINVADS